jgi:hypothetical protein
MRFITEYKHLPHDANEYAEHYRHNANSILGERIGAGFKYENPVNDNHLHYRLEIEAFPMDKWIEFKNSLFEYIVNSGGMVSGTRILEMIKALEFQGEKQKLPG